MQRGNSSPETESGVSRGGHVGNAATGRIPALELKDIVKTFGHVEALRGADFDVHAGEVVGLVGDNGAGKSTLVKVMSGVYRPDAGQIYMDGNPVSIDSPLAARQHGIEVVYQDLGLAPDLDAVENLFIGRELLRGGWFGRAIGLLDRGRMLKETHRAMSRFELDIPTATQMVGTLSGGQQQRIAIVNAVMGEGSVLLLDEPTAALGVAARRKVNDLIRSVRDQGAGVVVISHDLPDLIEVADRLHIMRLGTRVAVLDKSEAELDHVVDIMSGVTE